MLECGGTWSCSDIVQVTSATVDVMPKGRHFLALCLPALTFFLFSLLDVLVGERVDIDAPFQAEHSQ